MTACRTGWRIRPDLSGKPVLENPLPHCRHGRIPLPVKNPGFLETLNCPGNPLQYSDSCPL
ncbi:MAG: hypothetical protein LC657_17150, partial [Desulfobacteraceae bacterium]|nr:hypothetical protein [Desulfobacteraceae bacterium]